MFRSGVIHVDLTLDGILGGSTLEYVRLHNGYIYQNVIGTYILDPMLINLGGLDEVNVGNTAIAEPHFIMEETR